MVGNTKNWVISFGPFRAVKARRLLERNGVPLHIGSRAFDILAHLLEHPGRVVSHRALLDAAWPGIAVEEGNLRFQMTALRKVLSGSEPKYIVNVPGRGYCFAAPISRSDDVDLPGMPSLALAERIAPPTSPVKLVGRDEVVVEIAKLVRAQRVVTVTGPGGMGKTSVALAVANRLEESFRGNVYVVELASVEDPNRVEEALAAVLGLPPRNEDRTGGIVSMLKSRQMLLIVDGCEHLIDAVATLLHKIITATDISALVTSREVLRIEGEWVFQLGALPSPPRDKGLSPAEVLSYPAAQLFVERAGIANDAIASSGEADLVARICSRLDGLALAIELAASQAQIFGFERLDQMLENNGLSLTWPGRRAAPLKHHTLGGMLEWSYRLLPEAERSTLRALSIFSDEFTLEEAIIVANDVETGVDTSHSLAELVLKSLVCVNRSDKGARYRLLETTRVYAREMLADAGEIDVVRRRHASSCLHSHESRNGADLSSSAP